MNILDKWLPNMLSLILIVLLAFNLVRSCVRPKIEAPELVQTVHKTDTVYVQQIMLDTIRLIEKETVFKPKIVKVFLPDTARRKRIEQDTLIVGLEVRGKDLEIQQITPNGVSLLNQYQMPYRSPYLMTMDYRGNLQLREDPKAIQQKKMGKALADCRLFCLRWHGLLSRRKAKSLSLIRGAKNCRRAHENQINYETVSKGSIVFKLFQDIFKAKPVIYSM